MIRRMLVGGASAVVLFTLAGTSAAFATGVPPIEPAPPADCVPVEWVWATGAVPCEPPLADCESAADTGLGLDGDDAGEGEYCDIDDGQVSLDDGDHATFDDTSGDDAVAEDQMCTVDAVDAASVGVDFAL